jgi:hypothetical protein
LNSSVVDGHNRSHFRSIISSAHSQSTVQLDFCTFQVVAVAVATLVVAVVLEESSTRPTTMSRLAQPTPLSSAKEGKGAWGFMMMVPMGMTPYFLDLAHK